MGNRRRCGLPGLETPCVGWSCPVYFAGGFSAAWDAVFLGSFGRGGLFGDLAEKQVLACQRAEPALT